ncbi:hypothetical protein SLS58_003791 [Diplodia intermedia]|uniref:Uncharacterized protein n=1 Tax=Diplodia intermedia TaxID=856260 RepID=A0ABR3TVE1_9PEZI
MARDDDLIDEDQNPIYRDNFPDKEPRHDAADLKEFSERAIIAELHRVQLAQGVAISADVTKDDAIAQLLGPLYRPCLNWLRRRCGDLGLDEASPAWKLRKALDRRHRDDQFVPESQLWTPQELLKLCSFRGLGGSVDNPASLLYRLLKYELSVAQDRPQRDNRSWRSLSTFPTTRKGDTSYGKS